MFDHEFMKSFFRFLEGAADDELTARLDALQQLKRSFDVTSDVYADACFLERKLQQEQVTRATIPRRTGSGSPR